MAKRIVKKAEVNKITALKEIDNISKKIIELFDSLEQKDKLKLLEQLGCGSKYFTCQKCGKIKDKAAFYFSTEPNYATGVTKICKVCAADIAMPVINGERQQPNKDTVDNALYALNKPFLDSVWEASMLEAANQASGKIKTNVWASYAKNIQMPNYYKLTYSIMNNFIRNI